MDSVGRHVSCPHTAAAAATPECATSRLCVPSPTCALAAKRRGSRRSWSSSLSTPEYAGELVEVLEGPQSSGRRAPLAYPQIPFFEQF
jgi:hypothetical protein